MKAVTQMSILNRSRLLIATLATLSFSLSCGAGVGVLLVTVTSTGPLSGVAALRVDVTLENGPPQTLKYPVSGSEKSPLNTTFSISFGPERAGSGTITVTAVGADGAALAKSRPATVSFVASEQTSQFVSLSACPQMCNGICVDLTTSNQNCGACNNACGEGQSCNGSVCVTTGMTGCNGLLLCQNACGSASCFMGCANNATAEGRALFQSLLDCIEMTTNCPSMGTGSVCNSTDPSYDVNKCATCIQDVQMMGACTDMAANCGACINQVTACNMSMP